MALIGATVALGIVLLKEGVDRTQRGTGQGTVKPEPGTRVVSVKRTSAQDFDPAGDDEEHSAEAPLAVDKDSGTDWTTEGYSSADLGKEGVGIYVDADPGVDARSIAIDTPDPGWKAEIRVADGKQPAEGDLGLGEGRGRHGRQGAQALPPQRRPPPLLPGLDHRPRARGRARQDLRDHAVRAAASTR